MKWVDRLKFAIREYQQFFTLTKQPQNLDKRIYGFDPCCQARELGSGDSLPNLWNGVSITSQADADRMLPELFRVPGKHWVSYEPALGEVDFLVCPKCHSKHWNSGGPLGRHCCKCDADLGMPDWIVIGSHNQPKKYPCSNEWMIDVVEQCKAAAVPVWVKQIEIDGKVCTDIKQFPKELQVRELP